MAAWSYRRCAGYVPTADVDARRSKLDPTRSIVTACRTGKRSETIAELLAWAVSMRRTGTREQGHGDGTACRSCLPMGDRVREISFVIDPPSVAASYKPFGNVIDSGATSGVPTSSWIWA